MAPRRELAEGGAGHAQGHRESSRGAVALVGLLGQGLAQHGDEARGDALGPRPFEGDGVVEVLEHGGERRLALERDLAREQLVRHDPQRVDVAAEVHVVAARVLGAHVLRRAQHVSGGGGRVPLLGQVLLGDVEVHEVGHPPAVQHDVGGLHVAMDDPHVVQGLQAGSDLHRALEGLLGSEALAGGPQERLQVLALEQLHGEVEPALLLVGGVDPAHVGVPHLAGQLHLRAEPPDHLRPSGEVGAQHLDRDLVAEHLVARLVDRTHASAPDEVLDLVAAGQHRAPLDGRRERLPAGEAGQGVRIVFRVAGRTEHGTGGGYARAPLRPQGALRG